VRDGLAFAEPASELCEVCLTEAETNNLLFAPVSFVDVSRLPECARRYFPLPIHIESVDAF